MHRAILKWDDLLIMDGIMFEEEKGAALNIVSHVIL